MVWMISDNLTDNFCELFNYSIRSVIISKLLSNDELTINELEIYNVKGVCKTSTAHKRTVNNHLTELRKKGFVKYRRDGLRIYWSLNRDNEVIGKLKLLFLKEGNNHKKKWSKDTDYEIKQYLFGYYDYFEKFKPSELKAKLGFDSYPISSARLSQVLKGFVDQGILRKEDRARYKIIDKQGYENYN